jgi:hypothetical protein
MFDSRQLLLSLNPSTSLPLICTPTHCISRHHKHHTWRLLHSLLHLPSNPQGQSRCLLPHVRLKMPCGQTPHLPNYWKPTTKETNPGLQTPPRNSPHERSILQPRLPAHRVIQKCPMVNADSLESTIAVNTNTTKNPRRGMGGGRDTRLCLGVRSSPSAYITWPINS